MTYCSSTSLFTGPALAAALLASPVAASRVVAQEAIMLETLGAVRMASPEEVKRMDADVVLARQRAAASAATAPERHAATAD